MSNTGTNKTKHFPQLFASGPQICLQPTEMAPLSFIILHIKLDTIIYRYKDANMRRDLL